jgi:AraC family transcriptional regulator
MNRLPTEDRLAQGEGLEPDCQLWNRTSVSDHVAKTSHEQVQVESFGRGEAMNQPAANVPITMGSPTFRSLGLDGFEVTEAWFPAGEVLADHTHNRACVAVMLDGSFDLRFSSHAYACPPTTVFTEPAGEIHANFIGMGGAHVIVVQPDPAYTELLRPFAGLVNRATHRHHGGVAERASRLARELEAPDDLSTFAAEGVVLEMLATLVRLETAESRRPPSWLLRAQEMLHAQFAAGLRAADIARAVDVHPAHLARAFRAHFKLSMGSYVRRLRLDWAARELVRSDTSLAAVALEAGFADQSHFTRFFRRYTGLTPQAYRRAMRC